MILEAFSQVLQHNTVKAPATVLLSQWLLNILLAEPSDTVSRVIHAEIGIAEDAYNNDDTYGSDYGIGFLAHSASGWRLLKTLWAYARSYDHWQFRRWLHRAQASDFKTVS
ncbi:MAG: hypothetical protein VKK59_01375 [Vampirovibrionales bacterium]|nr:hypothetical protein [Vampirovibrionales bacterium]